MEKTNSKYDRKTDVLFVCTGNAGRSQMAQAMFLKLADGRFSAESAGVEPWDHLHPVAVKIMASKGICLEGQYPKSVSLMIDRNFDYVVTIGEPARTKIPSIVIENAEWIHWDLPDPADWDGTSGSYDAFFQTAVDIETKLADLINQICQVVSNT